MKKLIAIFLITVVSGLILIACHRDEGVRAASQAAALTDKPGNQEIRGELLRVDVPKKMFSVRIENGMEQTFRFEDQTMVMGLETPPVQKPATAEAKSGSRVLDVVDKEGSEVTIQWKDAGDTAKLATRVAVTEVVTTKQRRGGKRRPSRF